MTDEIKGDKKEGVSILTHPLLLIYINKTIEDKEFQRDDSMPFCFEMPDFYALSLKEVSMELISSLNVLSIFNRFSTCAQL